MRVEEVEAAALMLPRPERARLAHVPIASLDEDAIAQAWADEAERRYEELRSGVVEGLSTDEVFARIRTRDRRNSRI